MEPHSRGLVIGCLIFTGSGIFNLISVSGNRWIGGLLTLFGVVTLCWYIGLNVKKRREKSMARDTPAARAALEAAIRKDVDYQKKQAKYDGLLEMISEQFSAMKQSGDFRSVEADALLTACRQAIELAEALRPKWSRFGRPVLCSKAHIALADLYEHRGEYPRSASICVRAMEAGFTEEETGGSVKGRLKRLIDMRAFTPTEQMRILAGDSTGSFRDQARKMAGDVREMNRIARGR